MWFLTWFLSPIGRWLLIGGVSIALIAGAYGGGYLHGQINSKSAAEVRQLEATVDQLKRALARRDAATAADNAAREADRAERDRLDETTEEATNDPEGIDDLDSPLLSERIVERLRQLWR